jgi:hypothetical protein
MPYVPRYASVADVANFLSLDSSDPDIVNDILFALELSEGMIDAHLGVEGFGLQNSPNTTMLFSGKGTRILWLPFLRTVTSLRFGDPAFPDSYIDIDSSTYRLYPDAPQNGVYRGIILKSPDAKFPSGVDNIEVKGDWGFVTIPQPVRLATIWTCKAIFESRTLPSFIRREGSFARGYEYLEPNQQLAIPIIAVQLLRPYENHWRGM